MDTYPKIKRTVTTVEFVDGTKQILETFGAAQMTVEPVYEEVDERHLGSAIRRPPVAKAVVIRLDHPDSSDDGFLFTITLPPSPGESILKVLPPLTEQPADELPEVECRWCWQIVNVTKDGYMFMHTEEWRSGKLCGGSGQKVKGWWP